MEVKTAMIWSVINDQDHASLTDEDRKISGYMPMISTLFPGINYYSITGFGAVMRTLTKPVLTKLFPELVGLPSADVANDVKTVETFLKSDGYEWDDSPKWQKKFSKLLSK